MDRADCLNKPLRKLGVLCVFGGELSAANGFTAETQRCSVSAEKTNLSYESEKILRTSRSVRG